MTGPRDARRAAIWWTVTVVVAVALFWLATNDAVYEMTSPSWLNVHQLLRKAYSIVAFGILGLCAARAAACGGRAISPATGALWLGLFSGAIEIVQAFSPPPEGLFWNAVDVACGAIGGWLGARFEKIVLPRL